MVQLSAFIRLNSLTTRSCIVSQSFLVHARLYSVKGRGQTVCIFEVTKKKAWWLIGIASCLSQPSITSCQTDNQTMQQQRKGCHVVGLLMLCLCNSQMILDCSMKVDCYEQRHILNYQIQYFTGQLLLRVLLTHESINNSWKWQDSVPYLCNVFSVLASPFHAFC